MEIIPLSSDKKKLKRIITRYDRSWPMYLVHDNISLQYWERAMEIAADFQFVVFENGKSIATINSIPQLWNGKAESLPSGWDGALKTGVELLENKIEMPNTLCALTITIGKKYRGGGRSLQLLKALKQVALYNHFQYFIAPVRPIKKVNYPLQSMQEYATWKNQNQEEFDPWIRVHKKSGSEFIKVDTNSMMVSASIDQWKLWTKMDFQNSGNYIIPFGLQPLEINIYSQTGVYKEDGIWMCERLKPKTTQ